MNPKKLGDSCQERQDVGSDLEESVVDWLSKHIGAHIAEN